RATPTPPPPPPRRPHFHRDARHGPPVPPLPPALQPPWVLPPLPRPRTRGTAVRPDPPLEAPRPHSRPRRLHRRPGHRRDRTHHQRQLPPPRTPLPPDRTRPEDQPTRHHHRRRHRSSRQHAHHQLTPLTPTRRTPFTDQLHKPSERYSCQRGSSLHEGVDHGFIHPVMLHRGAPAGPVACA